MTSDTNNLYLLNEDEAKVVARALGYFNAYLVQEFDKIRETEDISAFVISAANEQYQELSRDNTQLHMKLAEAFPALRQL